MRLGTILKQARVAKQLTLRQLEDAATVSNAYLSQLESGKVSNPSAIVLYRLSQILEINFDDMMVAAGFVDPQPHQLPQPSQLLAMAINPQEEQELIRFLKFIRFNA